MLPWEKRPEEVASLLNPAFCSILLMDAMAGFQVEKNDGLPYPISFLVLPLVLHKQTREAFPTKRSTKMHVWVQKNPEFRIGFAGRVRQLVPFTKEAIAFGINAGTFSLTDQAALKVLKSDTAKTIWPDEEEPTVCRVKARFLGRWLSKAGNMTTVFAMWGVMP